VFGNGKSESDIVNLFRTDSGIFKAEPGRMIRPFIPGMLFSYKTLFFSGGNPPSTSRAAEGSCVRAPDKSSTIIYVILPISSFA